MAGNNNADQSRKRKLPPTFPTSFPYFPTSSPRTKRPLRPLQALAGVLPSSTSHRDVAPHSQHPPHPRARSPGTPIPMEGRDRTRSLAALSPAPSMAPLLLKNVDKPIMRLGELGSSPLKLESKGKMAMTLKRIGELGGMEGVDIDDAKADGGEDIQRAVKGRPGSSIPLSARLQRLIQRHSSSRSLFHASLSHMTGRSLSITNLDGADVIIEIISVVQPIKHGVPLFRVRMIKGSEVALKPVWTSTMYDDDDPFRATTASTSKPLASSVVSFSIPAQDEADTAVFHPRQVADVLLAADSWAVPSHPVTSKSSVQFKVFKAGLWKPWDVIELGGRGGRMALNECKTVLLCSRYWIVRE